MNHLGILILYSIQGPVKWTKSFIMESYGSIWILRKQISFCVFLCKDMKEITKSETISYLV